MKFISITIEQSIDSPIRKATFLVDGLSPPPLNSNIVITSPDYAGVDHCLFVGFIPNQGITRAPAANQVSVTGFDYGFNFANEKWMPGGTEYDNNIKDWKLDEYIHWCIAPHGYSATIHPSSSTSTTGYNLYTNVYPWRIPAKLNVTPATDKQFSFSTSRLEIMKTLAEDNGCIFHFKPWDVFNSSRYKCALYFIDADDIDSSSLGFQLPAGIEFALTSSYLASPLQIQQNESRRYNTITVYGAEVKGTIGGSGILNATVSTPAVQACEERPHTYSERSTALDTYQKCLDRANLLYTFYSTQSDTVIAKFVNRTDLELYQKIKFTGLTDTRGNTIGWLRIVNIKYTLTGGLTLVEVQCSNKVDLSPVHAVAEASKTTSSATTPSLAKTISSVTRQTVKTTPNYDTGQLENQIGTVTAVDNDTELGTVYTDYGQEIRNVKLPKQS